MIAALPLNVKHGLILAKAARIASIARPTEDLTSHFDLQEDIHVDDFITSYMLKTFLMNVLPRHKLSDDCNCIGNISCESDDPNSDADTETDDSNTATDSASAAPRQNLLKSSQCKWLALHAKRGSACSWAIRIYKELKTHLEVRTTLSLCLDFGSVMSPCYGDRGCCKKRKLTLAMTSQILDWFQQHKEKLNGIIT